MDTVSILIPCYNSEAHLEETIESALRQTWSNCEIIVVDDGSTDDSLEVARTYEGRRVRVIAQSNQGAPAARNRALEAAMGEYIQYLDADDLLHPRKIEAQVTALRKRTPKTLGVCSTVYFQDGEMPEEGRRAKGDEHIPWLTSEDPVQWLINLWMPRRGWGMVQTGAWLVPRDVAEEAGPWDEQLTRDQDGEYFTRVVLTSSGIQYVGEGCVYYRNHDGMRVSADHSRRAFESLLRSTDTRRECLLPRTSVENREEAQFAIARSYWKIAVRALPLYDDIYEEAVDRAKRLCMSEPPESVLPATRKSRVAQRLFGWRAARYLQCWYRRLTSETV
ncbi:glycosyltransferase family 2 protein [Salinibacter altiplanensis]|uniref:glycosyltransferase family 2 protein n=1 Tax=Salinibacter altiplanensis TaxID=1803181 RepID=UPI000C9F3EC7|nr:glycosyltransferase family 2 protein [Salinibacter altiplanensis]